MEDRKQSERALNVDELKIPQEQLSGECSKVIEVKKNERLTQCESFKISSSQIKKIIIENYITEEDDSKQKQNTDKAKNNTNNINDINLRYSLQVRHHHSLSAVNQSPENKSPYQRYSSCNNHTLSKNRKSNNNSNNHFPIPSIDSSTKYQDDRYRAKSIALYQKHNSKFERIIRNVNSNYQFNALKNSINNKNQMGLLSKKSESQNKHHQWDTLSSRIKANGLFKSKDNCYIASNIKETVNNNIDSTIGKKLFQDLKTINGNQYRHHHKNNTNILQQKPRYKCFVSMQKEPQHTENQFDETNFNKTIQIVDKFAKELKSEFGNTNTNQLHFSKTFTAVVPSNQFGLQATHGKINYYQTDSTNIDCNNHSFKNSFRDKKPTNYSVLSLHILSNWGNKNKVGVTEIQLFDEKDKRIPVSKCHVFNGNEDNINKVINNKFQTINDNDMWTSLFSPNIKIELYFDSDSYKISSVSIWNYNGKDLAKGIKEIELIRKNNICWKGIIPKGCFKFKTDYAYKIKLDPSVSINNSKGSNDSYKHFQLSLSKISQSQTVNPSNSVHKYKSEFIINHSSARNRLINRNATNCKSEEDKKFLSTSIGMTLNDFGNQKYITFNRLKIVFKENYGNSQFIGITGLKLIDKNGNYFGVETASSVGALPKDIGSVYNIDDPHIFENTFNNVNETTDETNMWLTVIYPAPYLEICYDIQQTLSQLKIYNYNEPYSLDKCAKVIEVIIDDDKNNFQSISNILLMKGIGSSLGDYSQSISFPFTPQAYDQLIPSLEENRNGIWNNYVSPLLPHGFWFKCVLISNHGDLDFIGFNAIEFYDSHGLLIIPSKIINDPEMKLSKSYYKDINNYWLTNYYDVNKVRDDDCCFENNTITVMFDKIVSVSYIRIYNLVRNPKQGVKAFQIFCDDCLIFEGELPMSHIEKNEILNESDILFITNEEIKSKNIIGNEDNTNDLKAYTEVKIEKGFKLILDGYN